MVRRHVSALSNHEATVRASSFEDAAGAAPQDEEIELLVTQ